MQRPNFRSLREVCLMTVSLVGWVACGAKTESGLGSGGSAALGGAAGSVSSGGANGGSPSPNGGSTAAGGSSTGGSAQGGSLTSGGQTSAGGAPAQGGSSGMSGGAGGSGGGTAGSTNANACQPGPAAAPQSGVAFPFPQNRFASSCIYPAACSTATVATGWDNYKKKFIVDGGDGSLRVQRPENSNDTVSEGIAYGMLFAVYMNDKTTFDKLWQYAQKFFNGNGLMHWQIGSGGNVMGMNSATDSDEDMGFALIMADKQWGGYADITKNFLGRVASKDFAGDGTIRGGDYYADVNPSYLAPAFYRVFARYTGDQRWMTILDKSYQILQGAANATTGLVPDWSTGSRGRNYTYDAARTPYRVALDACWFNEPRAKAYAEKVGAFFNGVGVDNIKDGYALDGMVTGMYKNSTFIGPAGVAGMVSKHTQLVDDTWTFVATDLNAGTESYFNMSWALFSAMMMTGNFWDMSSP